MQFIESRTFDELHIGDATEIKRTLRPNRIVINVVSCNCAYTSDL